MIYRTVRSKDDLAQLLKDAEVRDDHFLIKPNWFDDRPGNYTDAGILDWVLSVLPGKKTIIEAHSPQRNDFTQSILPENMDERRDYIRVQHQLYLNRLGMSEVLDRHGAEFVNITEEVWAGRTVDAETIREIVEAKYGPLDHQEFYGYVPQKLFDLRGHSLIDLARIKMSSPTSRDFSLTLKNLFGLLPQPSRLAYHPTLSESIIDVDKVYLTLFDVVGLLEGIQQAVVYWEGGRFGTFGDFDVVKDLGIAICGRDLVNVDIFAGRLFNMNLETRTAYRLGAKAFGESFATLGTPAPLVDVTTDWVPAFEAQGRIVTAEEARHQK